MSFKILLKNSVAVFHPKIKFFILIVLFIIWAVNLEILNKFRYLVQDLEHFKAIHHF